MTFAERFFQRRRHAFQRLFRHDAGVPVGDARIVLADLKKFARLPDAPLARTATGASDPLATGILIGRQEVVNRILAFTHTDAQAFFNLRNEPEHD